MSVFWSGGDVGTANRCPQAYDGKTITTVIAQRVRRLGDTCAQGTEPPEQAIIAGEHPRLIDHLPEGVAPLVTLALGCGPLVTRNARELLGVPGAIVRKCTVRVAPGTL